jgi:hypothetical protein
VKLKRQVGKGLTESANKRQLLDMPDDSVMER